MKHIAPKVFEGKFTCPHCGAISQQHWWACGWDNESFGDTRRNVIRAGECTQCGEHTLWLVDKMLYPDTGDAPLPNSEMPEKIKTLYSEAACIQMKSPRGAAALLRLAIQLLCVELGEKGKNINDDISALVAKGLPKIVQQSLDVVRVTGNNAVHPGQIDTDDPEVVTQLFELINVIVDYMIAMPKKVSGIYDSLPAKTLEAIQKRDGS